MEPTLYLYFGNGQCLEAMTHYANVLGGEIQGVFKNKDAPSPDARMPGGDDLVMNMSAKFGSATVMASDSPDEYYSAPQGFSLSFPANSVEHFDSLYQKLSTDAKSVMMPPMETFWADRFAMFTDKYGTPFMLMFEGSKGQG